jgi:hypothetical protein
MIFWIRITMSLTCTLCGMQVCCFQVPFWSRRSSYSLILQILLEFITWTSLIVVGGTLCENLKVLFGVYKYISTYII